jgi:Protein of unknown function (DUF3037)
VTDLFYSLIRYLPDPVRQEVFNVGVVVAEEGRLRAKVLRPQQLGRLRRLGYIGDSSFLRDLENEINSAGLPHQEQLMGEVPAWTLESLQRAEREWGGTVQFSPLRPASDVPSGEAVDLFFSRYVAPPAVKQRPPDRRVVKTRVRRILLRSLHSKYPRANANRLVRTDDFVAGRLERHSFDFTVRNSRLLQVVQTLSFDAGTRDILSKELDATKWALKDLQEAKLRAPISIVGMGWRQEDLRESAEEILPKLGARFIADDELDVWAKDLGTSWPDRLSER